MNSYSFPNRPQKTNGVFWVLGLSFSSLVVFLLLSIFVFRIDWSAKFPFKSTGGGAKTSEVGVLEIRGVIMDSKIVLHKLEMLMDEPSVKAIVVRLDSPGGAVGPSQEIYQALQEADKTKPVIASMGSIAASGGYYIACAARKIFSNPGTITGSIGVIMEFANLKKLYDWAKIQRYVIKTGRFKDSGAEFRDMESDEKALLQGMVDNVLGQFKAAVSEGRDIPMEKLSKLADGRIFSGQQAQAVGLVDELGGLQDAVQAAADEAEIDSDKPRVVYPHLQRRQLLEMLFGDEESIEESSAEGRSLLGHFFKGQGGNGLLQSLGEVAGVQAPKALPPGIYWIWRGASL